jgi:hypothetical protein
MMALPQGLLDAASEALAAEITWPPPWHVVAWSCGDELHVQPVEGTADQAKRTAMRRWLRREVRAVWVVELARAGGQARVILQLGRLH